MKDKQTAELSNNRLLNLYLRYSNEIDEDLFGPTFSNPYYIKAPSDWWEKDNRIMIVGEEGAGLWGAGKECLNNGRAEWDPRTETGIKMIMDYNTKKQSSKPSLEKGSA